MKIVCLCGIDGSGKSTLIERIKSSQYGPDILFKSFNYRTFVNDFLLANPTIQSSKINDYSIAQRTSFVNAYAKDFQQFYLNEIQPHFNSNKIIVCDRWLHCIFAFENCLNVKSKFVKNLFKNMLSGDLIFFVTIDPTIAFERQKSSAKNYKKGLSLLIEYQVSYERYFESSNYNFFEIKNVDLNESLKFISAKIKTLHSR